MKQLFLIATATIFLAVPALAETMGPQNSTPEASQINGNMESMTCQQMMDSISPQVTAWPAGDKKTTAQDELKMAKSEMRKKDETACKIHMTKIHDMM